MVGLRLIPETRSVGCYRQFDKFVKPNTHTARRDDSWRFRHVGSWVAFAF